MKKKQQAKELIKKIKDLIQHDADSELDELLQELEDTVEAEDDSSNPGGTPPPPPGKQP